MEPCILLHYCNSIFLVPLSIPQMCGRNCSGIFTTVPEHWQCQKACFLSWQSFLCHMRQHPLSNTTSSKAFQVMNTTWDHPQDCPFGSEGSHLKKRSTFNVVMMFNNFLVSIPWLGCKKLLMSYSWMLCDISSYAKQFSSPTQSQMQDRYGNKWLIKPIMNFNHSSDGKMS